MASLTRFFCKVLIVAGLLPSAAAAQEARIGLSAPLSEAFALLGSQMRDGAGLAAATAGATLTLEDDRCTAEGGEEAARRLIDGGARIVVGFLCTEAIEAAMPIFAEAGIPVLTSGVRSGGLTDRRSRTGWPVWRIAPRADAELAAVADILVRRWRGELFAIVDDGTIHGRELAESLRLAAELAGLQPVFVDTFRPQSDNQIGLVGRLSRAGATHVFVGGDRDDIAIMARDAAGLDYALTIAGGEALRAASEVPLPAGVLMIGVPEATDLLDDDAAAPFLAAEIAPEGYVVPTYATVEIALEAMGRASEEGRSVADVLDTTTFQTLIGAVSFDGKGDRRGSPYRLLRYDGKRFLPAD